MRGTGENNHEYDDNNREDAGEGKARDDRHEHNGGLTAEVS